MADEKHDQDINFAKVLFRHLDRIGQAKTPFEREDGILHFEILLCPYVDDEYEKDLVAPLRAFKNAETLAKATHNEDGVETSRAKLINNQFRALMKLAKRNKLLIEESDYGEDEDDTDYDAKQGSAEGSPL